MAVVNKLRQVTVEEYLKSEETAAVKHEYVDGRVFAMTGANRRHNIITGNIFTVLHGFLDGTPCRPFMEAMKARVKAANCFYYPDVMVACDRNDDESVYTEEPVLIIEVLSPSTAAVDRREKLTNYLKIATLREYLIVHQRRKRVECYRKGDDGNWTMTEYSAGEQLTLRSLPKGELTISIDTIYKNVLSKDGTFEVHEEKEQYLLSPEEASALDW
jgi:Uma2 family endonuclease